MALGINARKKLSNTLGTGFKFPFTFDQNTGGVAKQTSLSDVDATEMINQSITTIIGTVIGERVIRRRWGSALHSLVDEPINAFLQSDIKRFVIDAVDRHEKRIDILNTSVNMEDRDTGLVTINMTYVIVRTQRTGNMVFPFYLRTENTELSL